MNKSSRAVRTAAALLACALAVSVAACEDSAPNAASSSASQRVDDTTGTAASSNELPHAGKVVASISIPEGPGALAVGEGAVWSISDSVSRLTRIEPRRNAVAARIKLQPQSLSPVPPELRRGGGRKRRRTSRLPSAPSGPPALTAPPA